MTEADRELLLLLGSVGIRVSEIVTGLFEDSLSGDEQLAFGNRLAELIEGFGSECERLPLYSMRRPHEPRRWVYTQHRTDRVGVP